ncbi:MAG: hypothetical protein SynsKO_33760 [Synoicihabitans sp.]
MLVRYFKSQGVDQVQSTPRQRTHSTNITRILGNLGLKQYDVKHDVDEHDHLTTIRQPKVLSVYTLRN